MKLIFFARRYTTNFSTSRCYQFWWARLVMPKVLKITSLQNVRNISRKNWEMKLIFCMLINNVFILQGDTIFFDGFGQTCLMYPGKFAISLNISRKKLGVLCFNGGVCFSDGGCFIFKWRGGGGAPWGALVLGWEGFWKKSEDEVPPPTMGNPACCFFILFCFVISACVHYQLLRLLCTFLKENQ